jgi:hypothetical protein
MVASAVDFFVGIAAAGDELVLGVGLGLLLVAAGEADLLGEGEAFAVSFLGVGETVFSVVTETLGSSDFSRAVASGEAAGESSWATAKGAAAAKKVVRARIMSFIVDLWCGLATTIAPSRRPSVRNANGRERPNLASRLNSCARLSGRDRALTT